MEPNPYLSPEATVADIEIAYLPATPTFAVSLRKLAAMSIATGGLYTLYWFYQHWVAIRRRKQLSISPFWRTLFTVFCCYACFREVHEEARAQGVGLPASEGWLATGFIITNLCSRLPDPWWLISIFSFVFLLPVQRQANALNAKLAPEADRNERFTWANTLWLVFGVLFWTLAIVGTMLPPEAAGP